MAEKETPLERIKRLSKNSASVISPLERIERLKNPVTVKDCLADVEYTDNAEKDSELELSATLKAFKERAKAEEKRRVDATDSEFWVCVVFQNREQKEEFLTKLGLIADGDKYLDGQRVADAVGVELTPADVTFRDARIDPKYASLAMPLPSS